MKYMIKALEYYYRRVKTRILWKKNNMHNFTWPANSFDVDNVKVGKYSYGPISVFNDTSNKLIIGNFCSIAENVKFIVGGEHYTNYISTFPFNHYFNNVDVEAFSKGNIVLEDDVWVGYGSIILSNVRIGQGAVIAAGSVVTKDVPPYAIVGGNPAKILKYRFNKDVINELLKIDFSKLTKKDIISNIDELNKKLNDVSQLKWLLKK